MRITRNRKNTPAQGTNPWDELTRQLTDIRIGILDAFRHMKASAQYGDVPCDTEAARAMLANRHADLAAAAMQAITAWEHAAQLTSSRLDNHRRKR